MFRVFISVVSGFPFPNDSMMQPRRDQIEIRSRDDVSLGNFGDLGLFTLHPIRPLLDQAIH
jgi:hypothetical protein